MIANAVKMKRPMRSAQAIRTAVVSSYRSEGSLYKVLQRQYRSKSGRPVADDIARAELLPFKHLPEQEALAAFVEYTLLKELPTEANTALLEAAIRKGPRSLGADDRETLKAIDAKGFMFHWGQLLQSSSDIALMDERPPDDEIERAYLAIRKDLLGEYGRPRGALTHERLARGISAIANARLETSRLNSDFVVRSASRRRSSYINPPIAVGYGDRKRDPISLPFDRD